MTRPELLAALRAATEPDRALDAEIALALGWRPIVGETFVFWMNPARENRAKQPHFTGSIHAALTLFTTPPDAISSYPRLACIAALEAMG